MHDLRRKYCAKVNKGPCRFRSFSFKNTSLLVFRFSCVIWELDEPVYCKACWAGLHRRERAEKDVLGIVNRVWVVKVKGEGENGRIWRIRCSTFYCLLRGWLRVRCYFSWEGIVVFSSLLRSLITPFDPIQVMCDHVPKVVFWKITPIAGAFQVESQTAITFVDSSILFLFRPRKDSAVAAKRQFAALHYSSWERGSKCCNGTAAPRL